VSAFQHRSINSWALAKLTTLPAATAVEVAVMPGRVACGTAKYRPEDGKPMNGALHHVNSGIVDATGVFKSTVNVVVVVECPYGHLERLLVGY
jgi:hypothetical protein